ncbi:MAG: ABC transporter permease [Cytophagales bacterium]|nr:ABC transporter permease [Cytophagales bacterium]
MAELSKNLEGQISAWKKQLRKQDYLDDGVIEELEDHLREGLDRLLTQGISEDEAFNKAVADLGTPADLSSQEAAVQFKYSSSPWPLLISYFFIALRNIRKKKLISTINVVGLSIGMAVTILLGTYSWNIITYDQYHENSEDIYFLYRTRVLPEGGKMEVSDTWPPMAEEVQNAFPTVKSIARFVFWGDTRIKYGDKELTREISMGEQGTFDVFSFPLSKGNQDHVFDNANSIVINQEVADALFGEEDPMGKTVELMIGEPTSFVVTGVFEKIPFNSSLNFEILVNMDFRKTLWTERGYWGWNASFMWSFVKLEPGETEENLEAQFPPLVEKFVLPSERGTFELLPISEYYDYNTQQQEYGYLLGYIAIGLLLIAFFNFTNLNAAQSLTRNKEVSLRKVFGAGKNNLIQQLIGETVFLFLFSSLLGIGLAFLLLPYFIDLFEQQMSLSFLFEPVTTLIVLFGILAMGLLAGAYPTIRLSRLRAGDAIRGSRAGTRRGFDPKNILVTIQFSIAIILLSAVTIMYQQIDFMKTTDKHFNPDNLLTIQAAQGGGDDSPQRLESFQNAVSAITGVESVSATGSVPGRYWPSYALIVNADEKNKPPFDWLLSSVDANYFPALETEFVAGRNFDPSLGSDEGKAIINEAAYQQLGWTSLEGKKLAFPGADFEMEVVGVVKDFNYESLTEQVAPVVHRYRGRASERYGMLMVRLNGGSIGETLSQIEEAWGTYETNQPFEYSFIDEAFAEAYENEERISTMTGYSAMIAIAVAILGILGLASFTVIERMKEMAIRKVLGASIRQLLFILLKQTTILMLIGLAVAVPINYYFMEDWLADFPFRIELNFLVYVFATLLVMASSWVVLGSYTLKMVKANPSQTLRDE